MGEWRQVDQKLERGLVALGHDGGGKANIPIVAVQRHARVMLLGTLAILDSVDKDGVTT